MDKHRTAMPEAGLFGGTDWFDPIETGIRERVRGFIEELLEEELTAALGRARYRRDGEGAGGYRHGTRQRQLLGLFGPLDITVPRARRLPRVEAVPEIRPAVTAERMLALDGNFWHPPNVSAAERLDL
jgi:hypothetical protein